MKTQNKLRQLAGKATTGGGIATILLGLAIITGCATEEARKHLEGVAKGWCETIRASQVIPVYPLTEDLVVGDVFLVQTPIADQAKDYEKKGFLPLDDFQVRLVYTNFSDIYFSGYWKDTYGDTPHPLPEFTNAGALTSTQTVSLMEAPLPRAAFPSYSFQASSGFGLNAAFPIQGIPVALSYLNSQQVDGSVTISDARTYAGDPRQLMNLLTNWAAMSENRDRLAAAAQNSPRSEVFLRVVSRIYFARAMEMSLERSESQGAGGKGGTVNDVSLINSNGSVNANYAGILNALNASASNAVSAAANATQVGAAAKFVSASGSTVGISESFDRLLAFGYLGFDVPVNTNGDLGTPVPTFQHLNRKVAEPPPPPVIFGPDANTAKIRAWLKQEATPSHQDELESYLGQVWIQKYSFTSLLNGGQFADIRASVVAHFNIN